AERILRDRRYVVLRLNVDGDSLLLVDRDVQGYVARWDRQVRRERSQGLGRLDDHVRSDRLPREDRYQGDHALHVRHLGEVDLWIIARNRNPLDLDRGAVDREAGLEVLGGDHHRQVRDVGARARVQRDQDER